MNNLVINNRELTYNNRVFLVDDLYTQEFYEYSRRYVDSFYNSFYSVNEIYDNVYQDYLALQMFLDQNNVEKINLSKADEDICFYMADLARKKGIPFSGANLLFRRIRNKVDFSITKFASLGYFLILMARIPYSGEKIEQHKKFSVIRAKSSAGKIKRFTDIHQEFEYPFNNQTIYRLFKLGEKWRWVIKAYFRSFGVMREFRTFYSALSGEWSVLALNNFYKRRIVHAELYKLMLDEYFSHFHGCVFYTGNNLCRFSVIEDQLAIKHGIKTYNIPHGIEYGFKYPKGFSSDVFYANTQYTADWLNKLYNTDKYIFDEEVTTKMFKLDNVKPHERYVVYFSEPREVEVNIQIVTELIPLLKERGITLYLKLHPGDVKSNYDHLDAPQLTDYTEAMVGNVCVARKSTCLLEAIYNESTPIAIITNPKDQTIFDLFPSLNTEKIIKTHSVPELFEQIIKHF